MPELAIRAQNISRHYGERRALDGFDLEVPAGTVFGLLGPNGSGKSTFIALLAAMDRPTEGTLEVFGEPPSPALKRRVGAVFQENTADPLMRVHEYLRFAGRLFGVEREVLGTRIAELLGRFGLSDRANDPVSSLSGGMRRRLEVVRALLHEPALLVLDEPTTGVDADERSLLWQTLHGAREGRTVLLATNDLVEAGEVCDHVAFVRSGKVIAAGTPAELTAGLRRESVRVTWTERPGDILPRLAALPGVGGVAEDGDTTVLTADDASLLVPRLFEIAPGAIASVSIARASLQDAYFQHVGRRTEAVAK